MNDIKTFLYYEVSSSWLASNVSFRWFQVILGKYFSWKVRRKYAKYQHCMKMRRVIAMMKEQGIEGFPT